MSPLINGSITDLMRKLPAHVDNGKEFNVYSYYKQMTMDVICKYIALSLLTSLIIFYLGRCAFGVDTDVQNNPENIYLKKANELFEGSSLGTNFLFRSAQVLPEMNSVLARLFSFNNNIRMLINTRLLPLVSSTLQIHELPFTWLLNRVHAIVEHRQKTTSSRVDLLQLMLQVTTKETIDVSQILHI
jgi:hypothetical protein